VPYAVCMEDIPVQYAIEHGVERHLPYEHGVSITCHMLCVCKMEGCNV